MKHVDVSLAIEGFAACGAGTDEVPDEHRVEMPPAGTKRKGGRLPLLACALVDRALGDRALADRALADRALAERSGLDAAAVLFGTALGCLTETRLFVEHMIEAEEATPKPRAFASSVHNAIASKVALHLGARGPCQSFAHGETSFAHAVLAGAMAARRGAKPVFVGALDEVGPFVERGLASLGRSGAVSEGGGVLRLASPAESGPRLLRVTFGAEPATPGVPTVLVPALDGSVPEMPEVPELPEVPEMPHTAVWRVPAPHGSLAATATAIAAGIVTGTIAPAALGLEVRTEAIDVVVGSRFGDVATLRVAGPRVAGPRVAGDRVAGNRVAGNRVAGNRRSR